MFCMFCDSLSISQLVGLAEVELTAHDFPQKAYSQHHASYSDLIESANGGCKLCFIIHEGFQETVLEPGAVYWEGNTMDAALQDIESRGHATDMKVCINAGHLYSGQTLEDAKLLDTIMVQAGNILPSPSEDEDPPFNYENWIPPLELIINVPRGRFLGLVLNLTDLTGTPANIRNYQVGRYQINPDLGSHSNYEIARTWLKECIKNHDCCTHARPSRLPTRVIDVRIAEGSQDPRIVLSDETEGEYAALSHCWGGVISPLLTTENLADFQTSIPFVDLPANFRDAITITRRLEIQYLWIDSLCIVQNSKEDWETESKKMCSIYRDAHVMIAADAVSRSSDGILGHTPPANMNRKTVALKLFDDINNGVVSVLKKQDAPQAFCDLVLNSPLGSRGWTLQESSLSLRILHYGVNQIYWQCQQGFQSADDVPTGLLLPEYEAYPELAKITHSDNSLALQNNNSGHILEEYYKIVTAYTQRRLSFDSNKLPAFASIAEILHSALGGEYLAGIWTVDLHEGLLWYRELGSCKHAEKYRAPSWSWAVTNEPVIFARIKVEGFQDNFEAEFQSCELEIQKNNSYGQVRSGTLVMKGFTKGLVRSSQIVVNSHDPEDEKYDFGNILYDDGDYGRLFHIQGPEEDYMLSINEITHSKAQKANIEPEKDWQMKRELFSTKKYILLLINSMPVMVDGLDSLYRSGFGLVLAEVDGSCGNFTRVGFLDIAFRYKPNFESWMNGWEPRIVAIV